MRVSVNMMKERAPELEKSQAVAVAHSRDEDGSLNPGRTYPPSTCWLPRI